MFTIYGTKQDRNDFLDSILVPFFKCREDVDVDGAGETMLHDGDDELIHEMVIDLADGTFTVRHFDGNWNVEREETFDDYDDALECYEDTQF